MTAILTALSILFVAVFSAMLAVALAAGSTPMSGDDEQIENPQHEADKRALGPDSFGLCRRCECCDGHHENVDWGAAGELIHRSDKGVEPVWPHQRWSLARDGE